MASPRLQATLRAIADELAGGVETVTPRLHERIARIIPEVEVPVPDEPQAGKLAGKPWLVAAAGIAAVAAGLSLWRVLRVGEPASEHQEVPAADAGPIQASALPGNQPDSPSARP
ncbi:hypothetical protein [Arthrobacter globiformis]|uniref:hypothetical protein n=1 Tax=Arthrobacter globiformis TaxID=1665 RepID=UPI0027D8BC15|nr:hypothetical protein [Arthrobacter globiformis]